MRKAIYLASGLLLLASLFQSGRAQEKTSAGRTLKVNLHYTGSGTVDEKHKILVFLFDSPEFMQGTVIPFAKQGTAAKSDKLTFADIAKSPVYVSAVYAPAGNYEGQSAPPTGASLGLYSKTPGTPAPVNIDEGKTAEIELTFDDTAKMP